MATASRRRHRNGHDEFGMPMGPAALRISPASTSTTTFNKTFEKRLGERWNVLR